MRACLFLNKKSGLPPPPPFSISPQLIVRLFAKLPLGAMTKMCVREKGKDAKGGEKPLEDDSPVQLHVDFSRQERLASRFRDF